ncbi:MAG: hypothetical protein ABRQ38_06095 [Candidatus Eremiobacterota bacterium]
MFQYFYRIFDKYNKQIVSLAVFTGKSRTYQLKYDYNFYRKTLCYKYRHIKLVNYKEKSLLSDKNPFALVTLAVKYSLKTKTDEEMRAKFIRNLIRLMKDRGYNKEAILSLIRFIETAVEVEDEELNRLIYEDILELYKKEGDVILLAKFEQKAMEKGLRHTAIKMMEDKVDIELIAKYTGLTLENIKKIFQEESKEKINGR